MLGAGGFFEALVVDFEVLGLEADEALRADEDFDGAEVGFFEPDEDGLFEREELDFR